MKIPTGFKDYDHDGVYNGIDCKPYNRHKQGILHDIGQGVAKSWEVAKKERVARKEQDYVVRTHADETAAEERKRQAMLTAKYREQRKGELERKRIKEGRSGWEGFLGGSSTLSKGRKSSSMGGMGMMEGLAGNFWGSSAPSGVKRKAHHKVKHHHKKSKGDRGKSITIRLA